LILLLAAEIRTSHQDREETVEQLKLAQKQIEASQNAERAWVLTELEWQDTLKVTTGASNMPGEPIEESTTAAVKLICRNEGRSPAWITKVEGYSEVVDRLRDLSRIAGHETEQFVPLGPIAPGKQVMRGLLISCPGRLKDNQLLSLFVAVEYLDVFDNKRLTTCGYTVSGDYLIRRDDAPWRNKMT
jgi:hypothetical protein